MMAVCPEFKYSNEVLSILLVAAMLSGEYRFSLLYECY